MIATIYLDFKMKPDKLYGFTPVVTGEVLSYIVL